MRVASFLRLHDRPTEALACPTADGRSLRVDSSVADLLLYDVAFENLPGDAELEGFTQTLWVADERGTVWTATLRHSAEALMTLMGYEIQHRGIGAVESAPDEIADLFFEDLVLEGVVYCSDDRLPHLFWIDDVVVQAIYKYATFRFDIAGASYTPSAAFPHGQFHVQVREGGLYGEADNLTDIRTSEELPALVFPLRLPSLWKMNGVYRTEEGDWLQTVFPAPLL